MKATRLLCTAISCFIYTIAFSQKNNFELQLRNGKITPVADLSIRYLDSLNAKAFKKGKAFLLIQFVSIPTENERKALAANGIELLDYVPNYAYTATLSQKLKL